MARDVPQPEKSRSPFGVLALVAIVAFVGLSWWSRRPVHHEPPAHAPLNRVALQPMTSLNGLTKADLLERRRQMVARSPELQKMLKPDYAPDERIFGNIHDGKPWWGTLGLVYYGNGPKSCEGPSRESLFINNPYLLLGFLEPNAYIQDPGPDVWPRPSSLSWAPGYGLATYSLADYFRQVPRDYQGKIALHSYNARDFGFSSVMLDLATSQNVTPDGNQLGEAPQPLNEWLGPGPSCGIPGGCNNIQPMGIPVLKVKAPARASFKLWRAEDPDPQSSPDCWFSLQFD